MGSVDGRINLSDLGIKVPASASRLRASLFMRNVVEAQGDHFAPVGESEYEQLISRFENAKQTMRVRRLIHKSLHNGGHNDIKIHPFVCCCSAC